MKKFIFMISLSFPLLANAFHWKDLWQTKNQQAQTLMNQHQFTEASKRFEDHNWKATAAYRAGQYEKAAKGYQKLGTDEGHYNQGNALAHLGRYEEALKAYEKTLTVNPNHQDAQYNKKLVEELLKKDQQQKNQDQDKQNQDKQSQDKQSQEKQSQDKQSQEKQNQDKQSQEKQNQDKQQANLSSAESEQQRAKDQWLSLVPDDPGGLMREKFLRDHIRRQDGWNQ